MSFFACEYDYDSSEYWEIDKEEFVISDGTFVDCELGITIPKGWQCFKITVGNYEEIDEDLIVESDEDGDYLDSKEEVEIDGTIYQIYQSHSGQPAIIKTSDIFYQLPEVWGFCRRLRYQFGACQNFGEVDNVMEGDFLDEISYEEGCPFYGKEFEDPKQHPLYLEWQWIKKNYKNCRG